MRRQAARAAKKADGGQFQQSLHVRRCRQKMIGRFKDAPSRHSTPDRKLLLPGLIRTAVARRNNAKGIAKGI
jgi:hypothetical protein